MLRLRWGALVGLGMVLLCASTQAATQRCKPSASLTCAGRSSSAGNFMVDRQATEARHAMVSTISCLSWK